MNMEKFIATGCVDCGIIFSNPDSNHPWYNKITQKYDSHRVNIKENELVGHFIITVKMKDNEPEKVLMSCQSFHELISYWGMNDIIAFAEDRILDIRKYKEML